MQSRHSHLRRTFGTAAFPRRRTATATLFPGLDEEITERMDAAYREVRGDPLQHADSMDASEADEAEAAL